MNNLSLSTTNNNVLLIGEITKEFEFSHELLGENFYIGEISVKRQSNMYDSVKLIIPEILLDCRYGLGSNVYVNGEFRSFNKDSHLFLSVFVKDIECAENEDTNLISLNGYICKKPIYRRTPLGREICDITLAVNRLCGKSDYIPCIAWGRNALKVSKMNVGDNLKIDGRIQSREYAKNEQKRIAYEISIISVQ